MTSSSLSSSLVCFDSSYCKHCSSETEDAPKSVVTTWLQTYSEQLDIERRVDINHYYYVKPLRELKSSPDDCLYYSEIETYDKSLSQKSEKEVSRQIYRDSLLVRDLEKKLNSFANSKYFSQLKNDVIDSLEYFQFPNNVLENNHVSENACMKPAKSLDERLYFENNETKSMSLAAEQNTLLNTTNTDMTSEKSNNMQSERIERTLLESTANNEINTSEQCIGHVVIRMDELKNSSNRLFLNLMLDKNFLNLCKHISSVSTNNNEEITCVDNDKLTTATSIEMTIPTEHSGDIEIDISVDQAESSSESRNSNYESAIDLEDKVHTSADLTEARDFQDVSKRNKTWVKNPRPKSLMEDSKDVANNTKRVNRISLFESSGSTPFFFPSSTFSRRRDEQFLLDSEDHKCEVECSSIEQIVGLPGCEDLCHVESSFFEQTVGLPGFNEHGQNSADTFDDPANLLHYEDKSLRTPCSSNDNLSPGSLSSEVASYESFTSNDSIYHSDYNTLDSRMMDITSRTFETLLYIPRQCYDQVEDSLSDVTCSHFSSMENITRNILLKQKIDADIQDSSDEDINHLKDLDDNVSVSSDVAQWMKDIFNDALYDSDEDWNPKWFSSNDIEGRVYFFEENSSESSWTLPEVRPANADGSSLARSASQDLDSNVPLTRHKPPSGDRNLRNTKARSMILIEPSKKPTVADPPPLAPSSKNWPQLWDGHMCVLREGTLARTKITEHGKRLKKNWATSHVVLTELFLLFFKDAKQFHAMKTGGCVGRPELCVDLNGALIDRGDKMSSRRNVFLISTVLTLQVLIQFESSTHADSWLLAIHNAIKNLPSGVDNCSRIFKNPSIASSPDSSDNKKSKICRSKSVKLKKDGSIEDLPASSAERQTKIKARLKKFFNRRPTMDHLVKKGIYKDEPAFGCYLEKVCPSESPRVPVFVQKCIQCIEKSEENMKTDGLYRASGNLSQVQKIRLQVDQNNLTVLDEEEDVHVLAGALKLFFRELKEPLIPYHAFSKALKASTNHNRKEKLLLFRDIIRSLPSPNHDTFKFLLQHLLRVTRYKDFNRMHIPNLAIVFGPTLMWSEQESKNMALDFMQQNLVIECFLVEFDHVFR